MAARLWPQAEAMTRLEKLLEKGRRQYFPAEPSRPTYQILGSQLGVGYGAQTAAGRKATRLAATHHGLLLDYTYTAKAMAGLIQGIRDAPTPAKTGSCSSHRRPGRILRRPQPHRLIIPHAGNGGTDQTEAPLSQRKDDQAGDGQRPRHHHRRSARNGPRRAHPPRGRAEAAPRTYLP
jgi:hypothetical protein